MFVECSLRLIKVGSTGIHLLVSLRNNENACKKYKFPQHDEENFLSREPLKLILMLCR